MRRACSPFEAWGAWPRSRFAGALRDCLKVAGPARRVKKNCFVSQVACAQRLWQIYFAIWQIILHEIDNNDEQ